MKFKIDSLIKRPTDKELLGLWQQIVKLRAKGVCEYPNCGKKEYLNAHHIYSRSHKSTRYEPDNGMCLCSGHHSLTRNSAHKDPEFKDIIIKAGVRTVDFYTTLRFRAFQPAKLDLNAVKLYLKQELKKYE